jgi:ADP-ribose pyrophosphatase YjhB (NUDIX family)
MKHKIPPVNQMKKQWKIMRGHSVDRVKLTETILRHCHSCGDKLTWQYVDVEQKDRRVCTKCRQITYLNPKVVAGTIPVREGKVYLARRNLEPALGAWTYPAGYQEWGETVETAAARETWEEIQAKVKIQKLMGIYSYPDSSVVTIIYLAKVVGKEPSPGPESQIVDHFKPADIPWKELAFRSTYEALRDWVRTL